jgi:hypothetical protein
LRFTLRLNFNSEKLFSYDQEQCFHKTSEGMTLTPKKVTAFHYYKSQLKILETFNQQNNSINNRNNFSHKISPNQSFTKIYQGGNGSGLNGQQKHGDSNSLRRRTISFYNNNQAGPDFDCPNDNFVLPEKTLEKRIKGSFLEENGKKYKDISNYRSQNEKFDYIKALNDTAINAANYQDQNLNLKLNKNLSFYELKDTQD